MADKNKADHEHRWATYSSGGSKKQRCQVCFEEGEEIDEGTPAAPVPEPVDVTKPAEDKR